ncbi:MAG: peptidylprolyl isomerase [Rickettsiales bacterium]|jgi:peptidylprolyl isomerase|nr:peptidylprolyl isomerase [Rickettsiales bacterium]
MKTLVAKRVRLFSRIFVCVLAVLAGSSLRGGSATPPPGEEPTLVVPNVSPVPEAPPGVGIPTPGGASAGTPLETPVEPPAEAQAEVLPESEPSEEEKAIPNDIELNNLLLMELKDGIVVIKMFPDKAIGHVQRVSMLVREGFYDGSKFHRVIKGFMAQTGDPTGTGMGGSKFGKMHAEINDTKHIRGTVSMARANDLDSANSQFFIVTGKYFEHLDGQYTAWGKVIYGMELVDNIAFSENDTNGMVANPDVVIKMVLMKDLNYNYEEDTEEQIKNRRMARIEMLRSLKELKKIDSESESKNKDECLLDKIIRLNSELE